MPSSQETDWTLVRLGVVGDPSPLKSLTIWNVSSGSSLQVFCCALCSVDAGSNCLSSVYKNYIQRISFITRENHTDLSAWKSSWPGLYWGFEKRSSHSTWKIGANGLSWTKRMRMKMNEKLTFRDKWRLDWTAKPNHYQYRYVCSNAKMWCILHHLVNICRYCKVG